MQGRIKNSVAVKDKYELYLLDVNTFTFVLIGLFTTMKVMTIYLNDRNINVTEPALKNIHSKLTKSDFIQIKHI